MTVTCLSGVDEKRVVEVPRSQKNKRNPVALTKNCIVPRLPFYIARKTLRRITKLQEAK